MGPAWPVRVCSSRPLTTSQTFSVLSHEAETASLPFSISATAETTFEWLARVRLQRSSRHIQRRLERTKPGCARPISRFGNKPPYRWDVLMQQQPSNHLRAELHRVFIDDVRRQPYGPDNQRKSSLVIVLPSQIIKLKVVKTDASVC